MERVLNRYTEQNILKFFLSPSYTVGPPQRPVRAEASTKEIDNGGNSDGDPPLPIPNREVKPVSADGTAKICGRVGHRHFYRKRALVNAKARFFYVKSER